MQTDQLLDFETLAALRKVAPKVTGVAYGQARSCVQQLRTLAASAETVSDAEGHEYWQSDLKVIANATGFKAGLVGRALREMGLTMWRKGDGYHAAWSREQLEILSKYFKLNG